MNKTWIIGIAAATGMILGKIFLPVLGNFIEKRSLNTVSAAQLQQYISNSKMISFKTADFTYSETHHNGNMFFREALFTPYSIRTNYMFYDGTYKKYFAIEMFDFSNVSSFKDLLIIAKNIPIQCEVNNNELANPAYGSQANPVPSFKCIIPVDTTWDDSYKDKAGIVGRFNAHYEESVHYHLTYYVSRDEYLKMFPEQK